MNSFQVLSDDLYLARLIVGNLAFTWLNTNWGEVVMSRTAFAHALAAARILQLVEPKEFVPPSEWFNFENRTPKIPDSAKSKPGWTWRYATYGSFHCHLLDLTEQHINTLAMLGGYNSSIGLQSGNYAFGALVAGLDTCIQQFQAAIDEHPVWWHLHEGLGDWYYQSDEKEKAVQCYSEALKFDPKKTPSCAIDYWTLVSKIKKNSGDIEGAVQALRTGASLVPEKDAYTYWSTMGDIYKEQKEWKSAQSLYREAIDKNPSQCKNYWEKLASIHDNTLDWKGKMETYIEAMARDPDNIKSYADSLRLMAQRFTFDQLFEPALLILQNCIDHHPTHADTYKMKMAGCHMAACNWKAAVDLYEAIRSGPNAHDSEFSYLNEDLGHAYLGMGETTRALAAYQEKRMERLATGDVSGNSSDAAYIHMIEGDFGLAIRQIKADITETQKRFPNGAESWRIAVTHLDSYRDLGICYEAVGRMDDARVSFQSAVNTFERFVTELEPFVHTDNNTPYYRTSARALLAYGLMLEKVGRLEDASRIYEGAAHRYERTTFVGDDAPLNWEKEQAALALQRVNSPDRQAEMPSLLEEIGGPQLELRLCLGYRTSYGAKENSRAPRFRCGKSGYAATMLKDSFST
jgi:tetratricopeptide (TPR) repeat protein